MASVLDAWRKRKCYQVDLGEDQKGYVRKLDFLQIRESGKLTGENKTMFIIGSCVTDESGVPVLPRNEGEELNDFVERCFTTFGDIDPDAFMQAMQAIGKVTTPPDQETLVKNS